MRFKKVLCGVTAALTVLSSTAIAAQAEQTQLKLLTANFSEISDGEKFYFFGNGYFSDGNKFLKIGEEQIAEWSKTGKVSVKSVGSDLDASGLSWWTGNFSDGYVQLVKKDSSDKVIERYVVRLDKESGEIKTAYKLGADWCYTMSDGYTVMNPTSDVGGGTVSFTVMRPDGTSFTSTLKSWVAHMDGAQWDDYVWYQFIAAEDEKYCGYAVVDEKTDGGILDDRIYAVYGIARDGTATKIAGGIKTHTCGAIACVNGKNMAISFANDELGYYILTLSADTGKTREFKFYGSLSYVGENRAVGKHMGKNTYDLYDLNSGNIIASYSYIQAVDDDLFIIVTDEGKQGYIDGSNKVLGMFDIADTFFDEYAPVVKDGKAYLIDRNMNCVSEKIDGDKVYSFRGGLYGVDKGDSQMLMTYTKDITSEPTASEPTGTASSDTSSTTASETSGTTSSEISGTTVSETSSDTSAAEPNNPATGISLALIPLALIGGAAVIAAKKRK